MCSGLGYGVGVAEPTLSLQEQVRQGEKFLQLLAGCEAGNLGPLGARFLALRAQLSEFSQALAQRRQRLADAERLFQFLKQVSAQPYSTVWSARLHGCCSALVSLVSPHNPVPWI